MIQNCQHWKGPHSSLLPLDHLLPHQTSHTLFYRNKIQFLVANLHFCFYKPSSSRWALDICWSEIDKAGAGGPSATAWWQIIILYVLVFYSVERIHIKQTSKKNITKIYISGIMATNKESEKEIQLFWIMSGVLEHSFFPWFITKVPPRLPKGKHF